MAAQITVKKKKMTLKKAGTAPEPSDPNNTGGSVEDESTQTPDRPAAFSAPPYKAQSPGPTYVVFAILAVIATICFTVLVLIQWIEWKHLDTAFPRPIEIGHIARPPS